MARRGGHLEIVMSLVRLLGLVVLVVGPGAVLVVLAVALPLNGGTSAALREESELSAQQIADELTPPRGR